MSSLTKKAVAPRTVSIIGVAGRGDNSALLSASLFSAMVMKSLSIISEQFGLEWSNVQLVSGGAAWADHVAVDLFLNHNAPSLTVHLPCAWVEGDDAKHLETSGSWKVNPGVLANKCHRSFSKALARNTLMDIELARKRGAVLDCSHKGFHARNTAVAKSDFLIAFTWSRDSLPPPSGTLDTWKKSRSANKVHVSLWDLLSTPPATGPSDDHGEKEEEKEESASKPRTQAKRTKTSEESPPKRVRAGPSTVAIRSND